jgi:APA family basic amino acid/polyamine antiporter
MRNQLFARKNHAELIAQAEASQLKRSLGVFELTMMGIGAIIGTGIFVLTGKAAAGTEHALGAGPALTISFMVTGLACALAALCYAEFAAMVPISGSAYTYSYYSFGELMAWVIGWDLILEYAVGNIAVAIGWSGYFASFLEGFGIHMPGELISATGTEMARLPTGQWITLTSAQANYPDMVASLPTTTALFNLPAFVITSIITILLVIGIKESARVNASLVIVKLALIALFLIFGIPHFNPDVHWDNFAPNGWSGIMTGAALVFFAYVGFDAVSTTAEEAKNPQRDLPRGMIYSLLICTVLYIAVAAVLTGMVPLSVLGTEKPVVSALNYVGENTVGFIIAMGVTLTMPTVLLVMQLGQIRILYSMSRDGLIGSNFHKVHSKFKTPAYGTIAVGALVAICAAVINIDVAAELTNIGTLFAFVLVAIGVFILRRTQPDTPRKFKVPWYPVVCGLCVVMCVYLMIALPWPTWLRFFAWMGIGMCVYFLYSRHHSKIKEQHV